MLIVDGIEYEIYTPYKEQELEKCVEVYSKRIFGENSLYFSSKTKLKSPSGIGSIPDGYALSLLKPFNWFIIEIELNKPQLFDHVVRQLNKFIQGIKESDGRKVIINSLYKEINDNIIEKEFIKKKIGSNEVFQFLTSTIEEDPFIIIIIDKKTQRVLEAVDGINYDENKKKIIEFKIFKRVDAGIKNAFLFEPISLEFILGNQVLKKEEERKNKKPYTSGNEYIFPILKSLIEIGGKGKVQEVLDRVQINMEDKLTLADKVLLSGGEPRWRKQAKSVRYVLKEEGYLESDSKYGIWEISEKGRNFLKKNE